MQLQVYRTHSSSYQSSSFQEEEKSRLEQLEGVKYVSHLSEIDSLPTVLLTNTHTDPQELAQVLLEQTCLLVHPNSGRDNFSSSFVKSCSFPMIAGNPIRANAVCEYTLSCLFAHYTPIPHHIYWPAQRTWERKLIRDQKTLILGRGHIGTILQKTLEPLCAQVYVVDPKETKTSLEDPELQKDIDALIIATDLNSSTHGLIDHKFLRRLSDDALIINPARGNIIREQDLIIWLQKHPNAKAYLDVFESEPFDPGYLQDIPNLNKTAHIAGVYNRLNRDIIEFEYAVLKDFIQLYRSDSPDFFLAKYKDALII